VPHIVCRVVTTVILLLPCAAARAQAPAPASETAFSELDLRAARLYLRPDARLRELYRTHAGLGFEIETPFDAGVLMAGVSRVRFSARGGETSGQPDFDATLVMAGWGFRLPTPAALHITAGVRAGDFLMWFDDPALDASVRRESELFLGAFAAATVRLYKRLGLTASASYGRVHLHVPLHITTLAIGVEYRVGTPEWLRDFLR
jgi:hypothetical protein